MLGEGNVTGNLIIRTKSIYASIHVEFGMHALRLSPAIMHELAITLTGYRLFYFGVASPLFWPYVIKVKFLL